MSFILTFPLQVLLAENEDPGSGGGAPVAERLLGVMEVVLLEANHEPLEHGKPSVILSCDKTQLVALLGRINSPFVRTHTSVLQGLMRIIPFLSFGDVEKMKTLISHFKPYMDFHKFDAEHDKDEDIHLECFCAITAGIEVRFPVFLTLAVLILTHCFILQSHDEWCQEVSQNGMSHMRKGWTLSVGN